MNILLLQLKRIGDLIVTTPAIVAVRKQFPDAQVTLVISNECAALAPAISNVDRIFVVRRGLSDAAVLIALARGKFDYCIDFTRNDRSALLTFLSGARQRVVSERIKHKSKTRARVYNEFVPHRMRDMQTLDYNLALVGPLGIKDASRQLHLDLPTAAHEKAEQLCREANMDTEFIVLHPGSARVEKFWPAERWAEVIDDAQLKRNLKAVITGGGSDFEQGHIRDIKSKLRGSAVDLSGKTDLLTLAALIGRARLLITVDSAPMHLAAATGTPQVVLFGPTNPFHWRPLVSPAIILQGASTSPVTEFAVKQERMSMNQISTSAVISAMESLLSKHNSGRARPAGAPATEQGS
ncbi:MAG: putative lipopolysaccharide heptosyltransferase III [Verrucomicrobiota bacterium]